MPTYEYACKSCGEHLEVVQSFKDNALSECPNCGGDLKKVFGNIGIVFKGSGFYKNDSRAGRLGLKPAAAGSSSGSEVTATPSSTEASKPAAADGAAAFEARRAGCARGFDLSSVIQRASLESRSGVLSNSDVAGLAHDPLIAISPMASVTPVAAPGNHSTSDPTATTFCSIR